MDDPGTRIGDAEREQARSALADHMAEGRISADEYDERSRGVLSARTRGDIDQHFRDLPGGPPAGQVERPASAPAATTGRDGASTADRLAAVAAPVAVLLFFVLGFAFHGWAWAWLVFLVPGILITWSRVGSGQESERRRRRDRRRGR